MFDPLDHPGIPVDHHGRHWHEFDVEPVDPRAINPSTLRRIGMVAAVEANAEHFDRQFANRVRDADARRSVSSLGDATAQHARVNRLCGRAAGSTADEARMAFGDLVQLITVHEIAEEQMIHPLVRRWRPDGHLADRLLDEESRISDALSDAVRAAAHGHLEDPIGAFLACRG